MQVRFKTVLFLSFYILLLVCFTFCIFPSAFAHSGGGPPFVTINEKYVPTNPYFQGPTKLNIEQDFAPETYLANTPVSFAIDLQQFLPQAAIPVGQSDITFQWSVYSGDTFATAVGDKKIGENVSFFFPHVGSYLVLLEAKAAYPQFITIDAIRVNVVPNLSYTPPVITTHVISDAANQTEPLLFIEDAVLDKTVKNATYLWEFEDQNIQPGKQISQPFQQFSNDRVSYVYVRVIDANGISSDMGFLIEKKSDIISFTPFGNMTNIPLVVSKPIGNNTQIPLFNSFLNLSFFIQSVIVFLIVLLLFSLTKFYGRIQSPTKEKRNTL